MKYLLILTLILLIVSCDVSSPEEANNALLITALDELQLAFNLHHLNEIMEFYSYDFLHNGDEWDNVELDWEIRLNDYQEMKLENIDIELNGDEAAVSCYRRFYNNQIMVLVLNEPDDNGDISYWKIENNQWKIIGNGKQNP